MDSNNDGMITYDEFVQCVKSSADSDLYRYLGCLACFKWIFLHLQVH